MEIDYETIFTADFIDEIAFPDSEDVVREIRELIDVLGKYDFSKLGFDIIGRIFERLIPQEERHNSGKKFIECRSEEEARYLKVFLETGVDNIKAPANNDDLNSILPELEALKQGIDRVIETYLESILSNSARNRLTHQLWVEILK